MAKRTDTEITKVEGNAGFLAQYQDDKSLQSMKQHMIVPRLKLIQAMTDAKLKERFGEGACIITPGEALVCGTEDAGFDFVPLFFFSEYCKWSDLKDKESPSIMERSFDPTSDIAKRAANADTRDEVYEGDENKPPKQQRFYRYVHHFCWAGVIYGDHPLADTAVVLSMERGEYGNGRAFITSQQMRRQTLDDGSRVQVPLWAQVWKLVPASRTGEQGNWFGFNFEGNGVISEVHAADFRARHLDLERAHEENRLRVDRSEDGLDDEPTDSGESDEY
jgi:hypothetical protein